MNNVCPTCVTALEIMGLFLLILVQYSLTGQSNYSAPSYPLPVVCSICVTAPSYPLPVVCSICVTAPSYPLPVVCSICVTAPSYPLPVVCSICVTAPSYPLPVVYLDSHRGKIIPKMSRRHRAAPHPPHPLFFFNTMKVFKCAGTLYTEVDVCIFPNFIFSKTAYNAASGGQENRESLILKE